MRKLSMQTNVKGVNFYRIIFKGFLGGVIYKVKESKKDKKESRHYTGLTLDSFSLLVLNLDNNL